MDSVLVKFPLTIKAKLTEKLKNSMLDEMRANMQQAQLEIQQINIQENRAVKQAGDEVEEGQEVNPQTLAMIHQHFGVERQKRQEFVQETEARYKETEKMALGAEIVQGQTERFVELKVGDNIRDQFAVEVVVEDDKIIAIRS